MFIYLPTPGLSCSMWTLSCGMWHLVPCPRIKPGHLRWECRVLATGPPGKSWSINFNHQLFISSLCQMKVCFSYTHTHTYLSYCYPPRFIIVVQSLCHVWLFVTPWTIARQASLSFTISWSLPKLMSIESVMPSKHLIFCHPLLLLPSIFPSIKVFSGHYPAPTSTMISTKLIISQL